MARYRWNRSLLRGLFRAIVKSLAACCGRRTYTCVSAAELGSLLASPRPPMVVDCRDEENFAYPGHIHDAVNIPFSRFEQEAGNLPHGRPVVAVCYMGFYSRAAAVTLGRLGHEHVSSLEGGMESWFRAGHDVDEIEEP